MLNRIKIVTSLMLVLAIFGLLQLTSGGLFFNALKNDKENFTVLQTIRQRGLLLANGLQGGEIIFVIIQSIKEKTTGCEL